MAPRRALLRLSGHRSINDLFLRDGPLVLEIRPNCECCDRDLPPDATEAMICSYECTFCSDCVEQVLSNVCPNCGGGFSPRPIRPGTAHRAGISLADQPASRKRIHTRYSRQELELFAAQVRGIPPEHR